MTSAQRRRLADQIRDAITSSGKTQAEIANKTGIDKSALSRFMRRERGISFDSAEEIAAYLGLDITPTPAGKGTKQKK
jgi:transcriptional regulator with XRE-family HTH domain